MNYLIYIIFILDEKVLKLKEIWTSNITAEGNVIVGNSRVNLRNNNCSNSECNIGNFYTDAILHESLRLDAFSSDKWCNASIALTTSAEMRAAIPRGDVTHEQVFTLGSYEGELIAFDLTGSRLLEALEYSVSEIDLEKNVFETYRFLHSSGLRVTYSLRADKGKRVVSAGVRCAECAIPTYEPLSPTKNYRIVAAKYVATGGYGYKMFSNYGTSRITLPVTELTALLNYFKIQTPVITGLEGRIKVT